MTRSKDCKSSSRWAPRWALAGDILLARARYAFGEWVFRPRLAPWREPLFCQGMPWLAALPVLLWLSWLGVSLGRVDAARHLFLMFAVLMVSAGPWLLVGRHGPLFGIRVSRDYRYWWAYWLPLVLVIGNGVIAHTIACKKALSSPVACGIVASEAMSEFKFACPVCGQHITADSSTSGGQIDCPTCFQKIVVPQAPTTADTKFILSAAQVAKPRPTSADAASVLGPLRPSSNRSSLAAAVMLLVVLGAASTALYVFRDRIFKSARGVGSTNTPSLPPAAPVTLNTTYPVPTNISWTLDLTNAVVPDSVAAGRIHGSGFLCEKAVLRGGVLTLSQGEKPPWDLGLALHLIARQGGELSGKTVEIEPERPRAPRVVLRWKNEQRKPVTDTVTSGYALKVTFGQATNSHISGQIYICLPDEPKSFVAGTFTAEIRKPSPPKSGTPKLPHRKPPPKP